MKIALVVAGFPPEFIGGTEITTSELATELSKENEVTIITRTYSSTDSEEFIKKNLRLVRINCPNVPFLRSISFLLKSRKVLKELKPDIIQAQSVFPTGLTAVLNGPAIVSPRGTDINKPSFFYRFLFPLVFERSYGLIALTNHMKSQMRKFTKHEIVVIPNGINIKKYGRKPSIRGHLIFVGRLVKGKGVDTILRAMPLMPQERLVIIGDGPQRKELKASAKQLGIEDRTKFKGTLSKDRVAAELKSSGIFVFPTLSEGFPTVLLEAMVYGLPIVTTDVCGLSEIIKNGRNGFLITPNQPNELKGAIKKIRNNKSLFLKISSNNKKDVEKYSRPAVCSLLENYYSKVLLASKK